MDLMKSVVSVGVFAFVISGCGGGDSTLATDPGTPPPPTPAPTTGTATLKWIAPSTRADSTTASLSEISGYHLYYGATATSTPNLINIPGGTATQYTVTLPKGDYYFRVSAMDTDGTEGELSVAVLKSL